jgi:hypothetical protein
MTRKHKLKYFISILFCIFSATLYAEETVGTDSISIDNRRNEVYQGTHINLDIFNPVAAAWRNGRFETSLSVDVDL